MGPAGFALRALQVGALSVFALIVGVRGTQDAVANGDTRTISIQHMHTKELTTVTFRRDGRYVAEALEKLNWALRDWRLDEPIRMDPRLFDIAWEVHREVGSSSPFHVVSAYRSPQTNSMLRRRSRGVAKHSQHTMGKAMDFYLPDVSPSDIRSIGMKLQRGGVGYYPTAYTPFIHLDVGSVRSWPRMTRDQLARLFPDGNTVHIAADGRPLEGYEVAKAQILARGGSVGGFASGDFDEGAIMQSSRKSLWASLFGWNEEDESRPVRGRAARGPVQQPQTLAYAPNSAGDESGVYAFLNSSRQAAPAPEPQRTGLRGRRGETQVAALPPAPEEEAPALAAAPPAQPAPAAQPVPSQPAPAPVQPLPAQPRFVLAPFPTARPAGLAPVQLASVQPGSPGQRLNWQQGPVGLAAADPAALRLVDAPAPPRRPDALLVAALPAAAAPPAVPALASAATTPVALPSAPAPRDPPARLVAVSHPAPPERPRAGGAAPAQMIASAPAAAAPAPRLAALPPAVPSTPPTAAPPPADRQALDNLFAAVATGSLPSLGARVTTTRARAAAPANRIEIENAPAAALGFSQRAPSDASPDRFSGPAVRPLPTNFTSR